MEKKGEEKKESQNLLAFSFLSALSVLAKPSFMMVFLPAMCLYVLLCSLRNRESMFSNIAKILKALIPAISIILFQFIFCQFFNERTESGVKFQIGGFSEFTPLEIVKVCIATFPIPLLGIMLYGRKIFESVYSKISYMALFFGFIEMFFLTNGRTGDFSWGYDLAVGITTMITLAVSMDIEEGVWRRIPLLTVFMYQVYVGYDYVINLYNGGGHWV